MSRVLVSLLGIGFEFLVIILFYETFWVIIKYKWYNYCGFLLMALLNILVITYSKDALIPPIAFILISFILSLYFHSSITFKILLSFTITAVLLIFEMLVGVLVVQVIKIPFELSQNDLLMYTFGVLSSKLLALLLVCAFRSLIKWKKQYSDKQFSLLMAFLPIQAIITCFVVYGYSINTDELRNYALGVTAAVVSLLLVFIFIVILNNQLRAFKYKRSYELSEYRLRKQIEHYQDLNQAYHDVRSIRHDMINNMIAISGLLLNGSTRAALNRIEMIHDEIKKTLDVVNTGYPPIDAVVAAKSKKASESDITIIYKVIIEDKLNIDQVDIAVIIANALDNAIEGATRVSDIERNIHLYITSIKDHIYIRVENYTLNVVDPEFRSTKIDKSNHGFGLAQIKSIAHKYSGEVNPDFNPETRVFTLIVLLKN